MASLSQWTWVWVNSGSLWWTGKAGVLWSMGSQRVGHDWATELNWWTSDGNNVAIFVNCNKHITVMQDINNKGNRKWQALVRMWRNWSTEWNPDRNVKLYSHCGNSEIQHRINIWSSNPNSGYISKRTANRDLNRYLYTQTHCSIIHNSQEAETIQTSTGIWIKEVLYLHIMEYYSDTCYTMYETWGHYAK